MTKPFKHFVNRADELSDRVRYLADVPEKVSWALDAALSAIEKDKAGYRRRNRANPDGGANSIPGELEAAVVRAEELEAVVGGALRILADKWAHEDRLAAELKAVKEELEADEAKPSFTVERL